MKEKPQPIKNTPIKESLKYLGIIIDSRKN